MTEDRSAFVINQNDQTNKIMCTETLATTPAKQGAVKEVEAKLAACLGKLLFVTKGGDVTTPQEGSIFSRKLNHVITKRGVCVVVKANGIRLKIPLAQLVVKLWIEDFEASDEVMVEYIDGDFLNCSADNLGLSYAREQTGEPLDLTPMAFVTNMDLEIKLVTAVRPEAE